MILEVGIEGRKKGKTIITRKKMRRSHNALSFHIHQLG